MRVFTATSETLHANELSALFKNYYNELQSMNTPMALVENGEVIWLEQIKKSIGKTAVIVLAHDHSQLCGFAQGQLKLSPDYLGSKRIGLVAHLYVQTPFRGKGIAEKLCHELMNWFDEKKVDSVELQVILENNHALHFWEKMGFQPELNQLRLRR